MKGKEFEIKQDPQIHSIMRWILHSLILLNIEMQNSSKISSWHPVLKILYQNISAKKNFIIKILLHKETSFLQTLALI